MTTNTLAAIRERADAKRWDYQRQLDYLIEQRDHNPMMADQRGQSSLNGQIGGMMQKIAPYADIAALLAIVDELTARAEAAEAALRDTSALLEKHCELEPNWNGQEYDLPFAVRLRLGENSDLLAAHAANGESAGNGGA